MTNIEILTTLGAHIPAIAGMDINDNSAEFWGRVAAEVFENYIGNGGADLEYSDKQYGYLADELDAHDVLFLGNEPDGDNQWRLKKTGSYMSNDEARDNLIHRLNMIAQELAPARTSTVITETQLEGLAQAIYDKLIVLPYIDENGAYCERGMGEMGDTRTEAKELVNDWMENSGIRLKD